MVAYAIANGSISTALSRRLENDILKFMTAAHSSGEPWAISWDPFLIPDELRAASGLAVVDSDERLMGFVFFRPPGADWEISLIATLPEFRKQGVARRVLDELRVQARGRTPGSGASECGISLEVRVDNQPAIAAYNSYGFKQIGIRRAYYRDGADALVLRIPLNASAPSEI